MRKHSVKCRQQAERTKSVHLPTSLHPHEYLPQLQAKCLLFAFAVAFASASVLAIAIAFAFARWHLRNGVLYAAS